MRVGAGVLLVAICVLLAPVPASGLSGSGKATNYAATGNGNCSFNGPGPDGLSTALSNVEYAGAAACGSYLRVRGPDGAVTVKVTNRCPECSRGHIDLSQQAFARIAELSRGEVPVSYEQVVDPPLPGPLSVQVQNGSSQWWLSLYLDNHGNALASVEVRSGGEWRALVRRDYNAWEASSGAGTGRGEVKIEPFAVGLRRAGRGTSRCGWRGGSFPPAPRSTSLSCGNAFLAYILAYKMDALLDAGKTRFS